MNYLRKRKLLRELNRHLDVANEMEFQHFLDPDTVRHSDDFNCWLEETSHTIGQAFGVTSEQKQRFEELDFDFGGNPHRNLFLEHITEAKAILSGCIYRIGTYGLPVQSSTAQSLEDDISHAAGGSGSKKSKVKWALEHVVLKIILIFVGVLLTSFWYDYKENQKALENPNEDYRRVEVDFYNWMEDYDMTMTSGYNALLEDAVRRNMLNAGPTALQTIEYYQEFRRKRDNKIASFLVAYSLAGGDTLSLKYKRKLPVNVHKIVESKWGSNDVQMQRHIRSYRLDTL